MRDVVRLLLGGSLSAVLLLLALPPANVGILGWICLVPVLWAVQGKGLLFGFLGGLTASLGAALLAKSGLLYATKWNEGQPEWIFLGFAL